MASVKVLLKLNKLNSRGLAPLYIRITKDRKTKFISLGVSIKPEEWNESEGKVKKSNPNSSRLNAFIAQKEAEAEAIAVELETKSKSVNSYKIKEKVIGKASSSFFEFADRYVDSLEKSGRIGTYKKVKTVIFKLRTYMSGNPLYFDEINVRLLKDYESYLITTCKNSINTIHTDFKNLRKILNDAINEELMLPNDNPFLKYKLKLVATQREYLTESELESIETLKVDESKIIYHHLNMFIFASYTGGLRISDILQLKWNNFDGEKITIKIQKTQVPLSIKVPNKSLDILKEYKALALKSSKKLDSNAYIFPILQIKSNEVDSRTFHNAISSATAYINKDLKVIGRKAKIKKSISFHMSRHTWATMALRKGMRIEYVSKLMGHSAIKETQIYAKIVNEELDKAMDIFNK